MKTLQQFLTLSGILIAALWVCQPAGANDQTDASNDDTVFPSEPELPARDVQFETSSVPYAMALFAADPKLLEQKYVAVVLFATDFRQTASYVSPDHRDLFISAVGPLVSTDRETGSVASRANSSVNIDQLIKHVNPELLPHGEWVPQLADPHHLRVGPAASPGKDSYGQNLAYLVLGRDVQSVESMARTLLALYDHELCGTVQESHIAQMLLSQKEILDARKLLSEQQAKLDAVNQRLGQYEYVNPDTIADLNTQQRLITVDLAGVKARIDACTRILQRDDVRGRNIAEQVESIKITAEIELVGLAARKQAIDEIIRRASERQDLSAQRDVEKVALRQLAGTIESQQKSIAKAEFARQQFLPFPLQNNSVTIHELKWEPGDSRR